jgi:hypothetical protein
MIKFAQPSPVPTCKVKSKNLNQKQHPMKKTLFNSLKLTAFVLLLSMPLVNNAQGISFSIAPQTVTFCTMPTNWNTSGNHSLMCQVTSTVGGASYYTYTVSSGLSLFYVSQPIPSQIVGVWANSPGTHTVTLLAYASNQSSVILASYSQTVLAIPGPSATVSGPMTSCPNTSNLYTASGATTYTWLPGGINSFTANLMTGSSSTSFTLAATSANGCSNMQTFTVNVGTGVVTIAPSNTLCAGQVATLTATGGNTYTWSTGSTLAQILVSPSVSTVYSLATNNGNCVTTSTHFIAVVGQPVVTINGNSNACAGQQGLLTASGANSYVWTPGGFTSSAITPTATGCYTVVGTSAPGCSNTAAHCITINPTPNITATGGGTVCMGSSATFTASGGTTYTWNGGVTTSTLNVVPMGSGIYVVTGGWSTNACTKSASVFVAVNQGCAIVWPGDANRDGVANNTDVLELGVQAGQTGAARSSTSIAWSGQMASTWNGTLSNGWNKCHADCNGDGIVNSADAAAVTLNFGNTHTFRSASAGNDITLIPQQNTAYVGDWVGVDIMLGDASNNISNVLGVAFDLTYDQSMIETDQVQLNYTSSFMNMGQQSIEFSKMIFANGKMYAATVRTDHNNVGGNGKIGELKFKIKSTVSNNTPINISVSNPVMVNATGAYATLGSGNPVTVNAMVNSTGLSANAASAGIRMFPNPANDRLNVQSPVSTQYAISDISGRTVLNGQFEGNATLDIVKLTSGTYFVKFSSANGESVNKLVIAK